jgi:hypothetical protein
MADRLLPKLFVIVLSCCFSLFGYQAFADSGARRSDHASSNSPLNGYGKEVQGFRLKLEASASPVKAGESASFLITLKNSGHKSRTLVLVDPRLDYALEITDPSGKVSKVQNSRKLFFSVVLKTLSPGQAVSATYDTTGSYEFVAQGTYRIEVSKQVPSLDGKGTAVVVSNTVILKVIEPKDAVGTSPDDKIK